MNVGQIVKLDDNKEYIIVDKLNFHNVNYVYLITNSKPLEIMIAVEKVKDDKIILEEVKDNNELDYVLSQFALNSSDDDEID